MESNISFEQKNNRSLWYTLPKQYNILKKWRLNIFNPRSETYESNREYQTTRTRFHSKAGIVGTRVTDDSHVCID